MSETREGVPLSILIVGAGLAGLATAISLAQAQPGCRHKITILEDAPALAPIGAGLQLTPNATRLLSRWGLLNDIEAFGAEPRRLAVHRYSSGEILVEDDRFSENIRKRFPGAPFIDVHRGHLQLTMVRRAQELGVEVIMNAKVLDIDFEGEADARVRVTTGSGKQYLADLLVGADGIRSRCREALVHRPDPPLPTGDLAYRIILTLDQLGEDEELGRWVAHPEVHFWIGPHSHVVGYSVRRGQMFNLVLLCPDDLPADIDRQKGELQEMKSLFSGWDPVLKRFLDKVDRVDKWKLMHRTELDRWVSNSGNLVLVGDACHPMLPYLAQGANSAMEDGAVLGYLLARCGGRHAVKSTVELYEQIRKKRSERIQKEAFLQVRVAAYCCYVVALKQILTLGSAINFICQMDRSRKSEIACLRLIKIKVKSMFLILVDGWTTLLLRRETR